MINDEYEKHVIYDEKEDIRIYKKIRNFVLLGLVAIIFVIILCNSIFFVDSQHAYVITTAGKHTDIVLPGSSPRIKIPFIQNYTKVDMTLMTMAIGYDPKENDSTIISEARMITKDWNFVNVDFSVSWKVVDPKAYLYAAEDPVAILKDFIQASIRKNVGTYNVDSVLTTSRGELQSAIKQDVSTWLSDINIGIGIEAIQLQDAEPPTEEVKKAFVNVEDAKQAKETKITDAQKYSTEKLSQARSEADKIGKDANTAKESRINEANSQTERFIQLYQGYKLNPEITKKRMYYEAISEVFPNVKVIIGNDDNTLNMYPIEPFSTQQSKEESDDE